MRMRTLAVHGLRHMATTRHAPARTAAGEATMLHPAGFAQMPARRRASAAVSKPACTTPPALYAHMYDRTRGGNLLVLVMLIAPTTIIVASGGDQQQQWQWLHDTTWTWRSQQQAYGRATAAATFASDGTFLLADPRCAGASRCSWAANSGFVSISIPASTASGTKNQVEPTIYMVVPTHDVTAPPKVRFCHLPRQHITALIMSSPYIHSYVCSL